MFSPARQPVEVYFPDGRAGRRCRVYGPFRATGLFRALEHRQRPGILPGLLALPSGIYWYRVVTDGKQFKANW